MCLATAVIPNIQQQKICNYVQVLKILKVRKIELYTWETQVCAYVQSATYSQLGDI